MTIDRRAGKKPPDHFIREESYSRLDAGPYIGKIKNNLDPTRSGRLQVYIPELSGGDETAEENWRTVQYASPFFGTTNQPGDTKLNSFTKVRHSYGMWFVSPDIGNLVICIFIGGDPNRGYWFACVPNQLGHHMVPAMAGSYKVDDGSLENSALRSGYTNGKPTVVSEFNENEESYDWANFSGIKKPIHEEQFKVYLEQGLEEDYVRGIISSSSQRESPSYVYGFSTPGRPFKDTTAEPDYANRVKSGQLKESDYSVAARKGGHSLVMDDGNWQNKDKLVRLRSSGGHQILMNDSEHVLYISNNNGSVWIEMTGAGDLNIYSGKNLNIRTEGDLNLQADKNIKINAGQDISIAAGTNFNVESTVQNLNARQSMTLYGGTMFNAGSDGSVNLNASGVLNALGGAGVNIAGSLVKLNEGYSGSAVFNKPSPLRFNNLPDTGKDGIKWKSVDGALRTIVDYAPTHEPWKPHQNTSMVGISTGETGATAAGTNTGGSPTTPEEPPSKTLPVVECKGGKPADQLDPGPKDAAKQGVTNPVNKSYLSRSDAPSVSEGVGPLTPEQTKALLQQTGWSESTCKYSVTNQLNYCGKYQMGAAALAELGYIKLDAYRLYGGNKAVNYPTSWTGKDGVTSKEDFLNNGAVQEKVMLALLKLNYKNLVRNGGIKDGDDQCTVAGMLSVAHLLGAGGAKNWRMTGGGADANGMTGSKYFNRGRYAVDVLAAPAAA